MEREKKGQPSSRATPVAKQGKKSADERQFSRADDALILAWAAAHTIGKRISWTGCAEAFFPDRDPPVTDKHVCKRHHNINDNGNTPAQAASAPPRRQSSVPYVVLDLADGELDRASFCSMLSLLSLGADRVRIRRLPPFEKFCELVQSIDADLLHELERLERASEATLRHEGLPTLRRVGQTVIDAGASGRAAASRILQSHTTYERPDVSHRAGALVQVLDGLDRGLAREQFPCGDAGPHADHPFVKNMLAFKPPCVGDGFFRLGSLHTPACGDEQAARRLVEYTLSGFCVPCQVAYLEQAGF